MQKTTTLLMFTGRAEEAIMFYTSLFRESGINMISRYEGQGDGEAGKVKHATFTLQGSQYMCIDSSVTHGFGFTPAISIFVNCDSEAETDYLFTELSDEGRVLMPLGKYPFSAKYVWIEDRFGVSWQLSYNLSVSEAVMSEQEILPEAQISAEMAQHNSLLSEELVSGN